MSDPNAVSACSRFIAQAPGGSIATERRTCSQSSGVFGVDESVISGTVSNVCSLRAREAAIN